MFTVREFASPDDFFAAILGPAQRDAHMADWRAHLRSAACRAAAKTVAAEAKDIVSEIRARKAGQINRIGRTA